LVRNSFCVVEYVTDSINVTDAFSFYDVEYVAFYIRDT
jgi:hypothetical protein